MRGFFRLRASVALRGLLVVAALAVGVSWTTAARADDRAELEKARAAYVAHNYGEAEQRLRALVDPQRGTKDRALASQARMYLGAVLLAEGQRDPAVAVFEKLALDDPQFDPDPLSFPGHVINTYIDVRAQMQDRIKAAADTAARLDAERRVRAETDRLRQQAWLEAVKAMAREQRVTLRGSRLVACLPFGAGQFQNGKPALGWTLLAIESALVVGTALTLPMYLYATDRAQQEASAGDPDRKAQLYQDRAAKIRYVNLGLAGAFAAVAVAGIVEANLSFVPERVEVKQRELPPAPRVSRLSPWLVPLGLGLGGPDGGGREAGKPSDAGVGLILGVRGATF